MVQHEKNVKLLKEKPSPWRHCKIENGKPPPTLFGIGGGVLSSISPFIFVNTVYQGAVQKLRSKKYRNKSTSFSALVETLFLVNRVEHPKINRTRAELPVNCIFGTQLCFRQTPVLISTNCTTIIRAETRFTRKKVSRPMRRNM